MDFHQFQILGNHIHRKFADVSFNEQAFPDIAAEALSRADLDCDFRLDQLADFLATTEIRQQPGLGFSNLPPIVYQCAEFYIELLIWMDSTTAIHQHAFSGAFRVLKGSSFHSVYDFEEREQINSRLLLGDVRLKMAELLQVGDVRAILSGRGGLAHALFHLDRPSVTIVVRTHEEPWANPQYQLAPPGVAYDPFGLGDDSRVRLFQRLLSVAHGVNPQQAVELLISKCVHLDFPRLFMTVIKNYGYLSQDRDWERFLHAAREVHGSRIDHLAQRVKSMKRERSLVSTRAEVKDPDLRFFLALLLNLPTRSWIYKLVRAKFPDGEPETMCCQWLMRLRNEERLSGVFVELARKANLGSDLFRARLNAAVPFERTDPRSDVLFRAMMIGGSSEDLSRRFKDALGEGAEPSRALEAYVQLRQLTELEPLFSD